MIRFVLIFQIALVAGCAIQEWNEEYYIQPQDPEEFLELNCSANEAIEIATAAVVEKHPEFKEKLNKSKFTQFSTPYSSEYGDFQNYGELKSIFGYKEIEHGWNGGAHYEESVEVHLSLGCEVLSVHYYKGKVEYAY